MKIPSTGKYFEIPFIKGITCAYCGNKTINYKKFDREIEKAKKEDLAKFVASYNKIIPKTEQFIYEEKPSLEDCKKSIRNHFRMFFASTEHLFPEQNGGEYDISNLLLTCTRCNNERSAEDFFHFYKRRPEIRKNITKQLKFIKKRIKKLIADKKISKEYANYPQQAAKTISDITNKELNIIV